MKLIHNNKLTKNILNVFFIMLFVVCISFSIIFYGNSFLNNNEAINSNKENYTTQNEYDEIEIHSNAHYSNNEIYKLINIKLPHTGRILFDSFTLPNNIYLPINLSIVFLAFSLIPFHFLLDYRTLINLKVRLDD